MKRYQYILMTVVLAFLAFSCKDGYIDEISRVEPGDDTEAPSIAIKNPTDDVIIPFIETETDVDFKIEVVDDIEINDVKLSLNGTELAIYDSFKDYRRALESYTYRNLAVGEYTIQVVATDLSGKSATESFTFKVNNKYTARYDGEVFYMPFEGDLYMDLVTETNATVVGDPGFAEGKKGMAYAGAAESYLTFPATELQSDEFSAVFWTKIRLGDPEPDHGQRAGILVMGPEDPNNPGYPEKQNDRSSGFRFFREGGADQYFKLNAGNGEADSWFDGGDASKLNASDNIWHHMAFTISGTECLVYVDGELAKQGDFSGIDWTGCNLLSIMSGAPRFTEWNHLSDEGYIDELRIFNKVLTQTQIQEIMGNEN